MQPGCKASGWEDRQDRLDTERKHGKEFKKKKRKSLDSNHTSVLSELL